MAEGKGGAAPAGESQYQIVDDPILAGLEHPLLIAHKNQVSGIASDTAITVPWKEAAKCLRNEKVRIVIGQIREGEHHPLMECLKNKVQLTFMQLSGIPDHYAIFWGKIGNITCDPITCSRNDCNAPYETNWWPRIHTLRLDSSGCLSLIMLGAAHN